MLLLQEVLHNFVDEGYVCSVRDVEVLSEGMLSSGNGLASFDVKYKAEVFQLHKGEVVDAVVKNAIRIAHLVTSGEVEVEITKSIFHYIYKCSSSVLGGHDEKKQLNSSVQMGI